MGKLFFINITTKIIQMYYFLVELVKLAFTLSQIICAHFRKVILLLYI